MSGILDVRWASDNPVIVPLPANAINPLHPVVQSWRYSRQRITNIRQCHSLALARVSAPWALALAAIISDGQHFHCAYFASFLGIHSVLK